MLEKEKRFPVVEAFGPTLQGEGMLAGKRTLFVRFGGCDGVTGKGRLDLCQWCDSLHAADPANKAGWRWLTAREIRQELEKLAPYCHYVTLSGGNPALLDLTDLVHDLTSFGPYLLAIETQGTVWRKWMASLDVITVSPKPPSAGGGDGSQVVKQFERWYGEAMEALGEEDHPPAICVKVVVDIYDDRDYEFARQIFKVARDEHAAEWVPQRLYLSLCTYPSDTTETILHRWRLLIDWVTRDKTIGDVAVLPQLHVLAFGHARGV